MTVSFGRASPEVMPAVRALVDEVFRGRVVPFVRRFPNALADENAGNVFVAHSAGQPVGVVATRPITWVTDGEHWPAAMLGFVGTAPAERGRGVASRLLGEVEQALRAAGASFAMLWTDQHGFYERLGWRSGDVGVLGEIAPGASAASELLPLDAGLVDALEAVRLRWEPRRVERSPVDWRTVPPPVREVRVVVAGPAYALIGLAEDAGYVYELVGDEDAFDEVWAGLRAGRRLLVNDSAGGQSRRWIDAREDVTWHPQELTMWLPLDARAEGVEARGWHIPWFDRI